MPYTGLPRESQQCHSRFKKGVATKLRGCHKANKKIKCIKMRTETDKNLSSFPPKNTKYLKYKRLSEGQNRRLDSFKSDLLLRRNFERLLRTNSKIFKVVIW
jgi:hypothetical protein